VYLKWAPKIVLNYFLKEHGIMPSGQGQLREGQDLTRSRKPASAVDLEIKVLDLLGTWRLRPSPRQDLSVTPLDR